MGASEKHAATYHPHELADLLRDAAHHAGPADAHLLDAAAAALDHQEQTP